jgi:cation diffusion facilitator CzcD-associated flavoprotein CzcO
VGDRKWTVKVKDLQRNAIIVESFDAVMVCNGHYFEPRIPNISGQDVFTGEQLHSHDYRVPEIFNGKTVVVLGAGPSGRHMTPLTDRIFFFFRNFNALHIILII